MRSLRDHVALAMIFLVVSIQRTIMRHSLLLRLGELRFLLPMVFVE